MKRALIIEDNDDNLELISFILNAYGYEYSSAMSGMEGYNKALTEHPDFILLDIQLPDISGTEVLAKLRATEATKSIPVIAMTSYAMAGDREKLMDAGCNGYIEKPIDPEIVIQQIQSFLDNT
ncbi:Response regulator receiver domain-containing protein [Maridesulfovibrio ferrireducens]|uniref:Response regulator receiver domain-containing protein n=1 Tax=Maridesulfovibrio ferrireducens TaxID=246191 RepID=A0A1G9FXV7_9BACT|nr:response regulator [Maridesulfovibrio ferrireducens]SDK93145.1 Response regulator receiver domain-containing protein [Maridesulfovibrio ferrireducens]